MIDMEDEECEHEWEVDDVWNPHSQISTTEKWCGICGIDYDGEMYDWRD